MLAGRPWGVTSAFALWGAKLVTPLGVDVTQWAFVPACGAVLAHWGADVIKVEAAIPWLWLYGVASPKVKGSWKFFARFEHNGFVLTPIRMLKPKPSQGYPFVSDLHTLVAVAFLEVGRRGE